MATVSRLCPRRTPKSGRAPIIPVAMLAIAALAMAACGGGEEDTTGHARTATPPTPAETATVALPTPSHTPNSSPTASLPDSPSIWFVPDTPPQPVPNPLEPRIADGRWQLLVATPDGEPKVVLDTRDVVGKAHWSPDGRALLVRTFSYEEGFGNHMVYYPDSSQPARLVASGTRDAAWSPSGNEVAFEITDTNGTTVALWLASADGSETRRLEGLGDHIRLRGWVPDGSGLLVARITYPSGHQSQTLWLIPTHDGHALQVGDLPVQYPAYAHLEGLWSPDGSSLVYVAERDVYLFDRISGESRRLTFTGDYSGTARWLPSGSFIRIGSRLVDPETGPVCSTPEAVFYAAAAAALSPDSRYLAVGEVPSYEGNSVHGGTVLHDVKSRVSRRLTDPQKGVDVAWLWTPDGQHLLVARSICTGCDAGLYRVLLVDVATGKEEELTDGFEHAAGWVVSPEGTLLLIRGARLRIASIDATAVREILPPEGLEVGWAEWSPDGSRFFYITAPVGTTGH